MPLWTSKKTEPDSAAGAGVSATDEAGPPQRLEDLTAELGKLGRLVDHVQEQVVAYLVYRESQQAAGGGADPAAMEERLDALADKVEALAGAGPAAAAVSSAPAPAAPVDEAAIRGALDPLARKLEAIESRLAATGQRGDGGASDAFGAGLAQLRDGLGSQLAALIEGVQQLHERLDLPVQYLTEHLRPPEPDEAQETPASSADWQRAIFGSDLAGAGGLDLHRQQLLSGVLDGNAEAAGFVGQLLVFRYAPTEKLPTLLKELGEAYYRWQPKRRAGAGHGPMEKALVAWITEILQDAGIPNTIELVHPGERFDSTRHTATARGVEITEVRGWVVLRDNGRVYTKALVDVK
jgi:hypothetical protein